MNAVTELNRSTSVATAPGFDPFSSYGEEASRGGSTFLKFSKSEWLLGQDTNTNHKGARYAVRMEGLMIGWVRWENRRPVERRMGLLAEGYRPEARGELGYDDQSLWELDSNDKPQDPWQRTNELPMADTETGTQVLFSATSTGAIGAIGNLCKVYGREYRLRDGLVPVVELGVDSYMHPTYKKVWVPLLTIVDWVDNSSDLTGGDVSSDDDDGEVVYASPPAKAAAGGKPANGGKPAPARAPASKTRF